MQSKEGILVVEDEDFLREMIKIILERAGYQVFEAASSRQALDLFEEHRRDIDLVVTDLGLADEGSGLELAEEITSRAPRVKVLIVSGGTGDIAEEEKIKNLGLTFLEKPFSSNDITRAVRASLEEPPYRPTSRRCNYWLLDSVFLKTAC